MKEKMKAFINATFWPTQPSSDKEKKQNIFTQLDHVK